MESNEVHWRDVYESAYLAAWDIEKSVILTIASANRELCELDDRNEPKVVLHFVETELPSGTKVKPMICIPTNCKMIQAYTGSGKLSEWSDYKIEIGIGENKGGVGNAVGLRIIKVMPLNPINIDNILKSKSLKFIRTEGNKVLKMLDDDQKEKIKERITELEAEGKKS